MKRGTKRIYKPLSYIRERHNMSGQIDKFGRKRQRDESVRGYKIKNGNFDVEFRQFVNVGEPSAGDNAVTLDYFSKHRFDFENKQAHAIADPEEDYDAANKLYVDENILNHFRKIEGSLQTAVSKTVKSEIRRLMSTAVAGERVANVNGDADDELEDGFDIKSLVRNEMRQLRCALVYQFFGRVDLDKNREYYVINNDSPFIGIIFDCKVLYAWITPSDLVASVLMDGTKGYYVFIDRAAALQNVELKTGSTIQFKLQNDVKEISGTLVLQYHPWMSDNENQPTLPETFVSLVDSKTGVSIKRVKN